MPRLQLTDEEVKVIEDFRRKNEVRDAWCKALDWCHDFLADRLEVGESINTSALEDMQKIGRDVVLIEPRRKKS